MRWGDDIVSLISQTLKPASQQVADFEAFVITVRGANFSVGANLMQLLLAAQDQEWDDVDLAIRAFQNMTQAIKFCPRPVVVAPYGMCLGGGTGDFRCCMRPRGIRTRSCTWDWWRRAWD